MVILFRLNRFAEELDNLSILFLQIDLYSTEIIDFDQRMKFVIINLKIENTYSYTDLIITSISILIII